MSEATIYIESPGLLLSSSGAMFKLSSDSADFSTVQTKNDTTLTPWAQWTGAKGIPNMLPFEMAEKIRKCGVLSAAIEAKARIAIGKGLRPVFITGIDNKGDETYEFVVDPEIDAWMSENQTFKHSITFIRNVIGWGWSHSRIVLDNNGEKVARYRTDDIVKCRLEKKDLTSGHILNTYYAADWSLITAGENDQYVKKIPLLKEDEESFHLQSLMEKKTDLREFSIISRSHLAGQEYYPYPLWYSCWDWVEMAIQVPAMKVAMMNNQMSIKYLITISDRYFKNGDPKWESYTAEERQTKFAEKAREINDHLTGTTKAYKTILTSSYIDPVTQKEVKDISIEVIDDKVKDGKLLPDSGAANKEVLFALMLNPAIMGANTFGGDYSGGAGSGSDIREAYLVQIMLMEAERQMNAQVFDIVKRVNGWDKKYPGKTLAFRYPSLILTTLDTGGSTAPKPM